MKRAGILLIVGVVLLLHHADLLFASLEEPIAYFGTFQVLVYNLATLFILSVLSSALSFAAGHDRLSNMAVFGITAYWLVEIFMLAIYEGGQPIELTVFILAVAFIAVFSSLTIITQAIHKQSIFNRFRSMFNDNSSLKGRVDQMRTMIEGAVSVQMLDDVIQSQIKQENIAKLLTAAIREDDHEEKNRLIARAVAQSMSSVSYVERFKDKFIENITDIEMSLNDSR